MKSYIHRNSAVDVPLLSPRQDAILLALRGEGPLATSAARGRYLAGDLDVVAERLRCEDIADQLRVHGVDAECMARRTESYHYVPAALIIRAEEIVKVDSDFCQRFLDRLASLSPAEAFVRTWPDCPNPEMSVAQLKLKQLEQLERNVRREQRADIARRYDAGELTAADAALERRGTI